MALLAKNAPPCKSLHGAAALNGRLPPEDGSERPQTSGKRVSGDPRHFIFRRNFFFRNFERPFTPQGWLRSASNFGKTRFRWSPTFDFSTPTKIFRQKFLPEKFFVKTPKRVSAKCPFWRSCAGLDVTIRCASKIHCQTYRFQPSTTLGGGVKEGKTVFVVSFGRKKLIPSSLLWWYDIMILWYYDTTVLWYYDIMILWYYAVIPAVTLLILKSINAVR